MEKKSEKSLFQMINSPQFTPELFLHYLIKKGEDVDVLENLIMRLYSFSDYDISKVLLFLM